MKYPKIQTLWKRDEKTWKIIEDDYSCDEFKNIKNWHVTEKIDGTNCRVMWDGETVTFGGRTDDAQLSTKLFIYLQETFTVEKMKKVFKRTKDEDGNILPISVVLFGEGCGGKVQRGRCYGESEQFVLFDMWIDGWWLKQEDLEKFCYCLTIQKAPPLYCSPSMSIDTIVSFIKKAPGSVFSEKEKQMEGVVCRSEPLMMFRDGAPIMFKLKVKDYEKTR